MEAANSNLFDKCVPGKIAKMITNSNLIEKTADEIMAELRSIVTEPQHMARILTGLLLVDDSESDYKDCLILRINDFTKTASRQLQEQFKEANQRRDQLMRQSDELKSFGFHPSDSVKEFTDDYALWVKEYAKLFIIQASEQ
jgi:hypothetical protein